MSLNQSEIIEGFETIAPKYDLANDIMTFGLHRHWRNQLIRQLRAQHQTHPLIDILDLGTGTGELAISLAKTFPQSHIHAVEPASAMLAFAKDKAKRILSVRQAAQIRWIQADAAALTLSEASFDAITMAWVIRNIKDPVATLVRLRSLLRPHGTLSILESGRPCSYPMNKLYPIYSKLLPYLGGLISPQKDFYEYYRCSVHDFPYHTQFTALLKECGYHSPQSTPILGGVVYLYTAKAHP
jgi:demethylmenaquinone methyltransferase/2-methoxy-6-polyprenyl-1,4-benzoquinol methylase